MAINPNGEIRLTSLTMISLKPIVQFIAGLCLMALASCDSKSPLPIKVRQREALLAGGKVAIFTNTSTRTLSVVARFKNPNFGTRKVFNLVFSPGEKQEIGGFEGWTVVPGESVTLESDGYTEASYTFID